MGSSGELDSLGVEALTGFITASQKAAAATAARGAALEQTLQKFPGFLAELRPTMLRLGELESERNDHSTARTSAGRAGE